MNTTHADLAVVVWRNAENGVLPSATLLLFSSPPEKVVRVDIDLVSCEAGKAIGFHSLGSGVGADFGQIVPQASNSKCGSCCWKMAEMQIEKLLSMGCTGTMKAQLSYFDVTDLKTINTAAKTKLQAANAEDYMTYDVDTFYNPANPGHGAVSYPCNFFYRPLFMNLDFTITGADDNSACKLGLHALTNGKFFTVGTDDTVKITRVFADWSMGGDSSNRHIGPGPE